MRRDDKRIISKEDLVKILRGGQVCCLSMVDRGKPYVVPVSYGYAENALYVHSAPEGRKIDILGKNPEVCFSIVGDYEIIKSERACFWSARYRSVTGTGKARILTDRDEKEKGFAVLMGHYSDREYDFTGMALDDVIVIKVEIETIEGKRSS